ncbi:MAG: EamA family transporter RarD [Burkholderiaceae bacterium]
MNTGIAYAATAYILWGAFPLYFGLLRSVPAFEVLMNRMVWALLVVAASLIVRNRWAWVRGMVSNPRLLIRYGVSALLIAVNWYVYIWAVQNGHVVDASLGYYITPLVNVLLGRIVLGERPRPVQWTALAIAAGGVVWLGVLAGAVPWISLLLAVSFGAYGLAKKMAPLGALEGLALETGLLFPFAMVALLWTAAHGQNALATGGVQTRWLLVASGPLTALPLLLFAAGARRIPMTTLGLLQYITPTLQLLLGVLVFNEAFGGPSLVGYLMIWTALVLYAAEGIWRARTSE